MVMTNEIARSYVALPLQQLKKFVHLHSSICTFFERVGRKILLPGYIVAKACASPSNSTWFTRPFLLLRGWGLGTGLRVWERDYTAVTAIVVAPDLAE